ncbi:hypothetical protein Pst134EA_003008 [Puccinia striiformis f. sp. tritici]|uniref:hypothetical protein n=1 Tax=Puccinia striiformis f. sp. tritici TaxID=168172 RepID=UPI0020075ECB|nr:hypothetical protein Pst134EA_003008 [Puccinia striiformis f. sp. tritici]KAH9472390.1 hypothetical protein Pst134EA_003008 [Puccinia striiformis f. sp. tritici]
MEPLNVNPSLSLGVSVLRTARRVLWRTYERFRPLNSFGNRCHPRNASKPGRANSPRVITKITQLPITSAGPQQTDANLVPDCAESLPSKSIKEEQMVYTKNTTITYIEIIQVPPVPFSPECCLEMLGNRAAAEVGFKRLMDIVTSRYGLDEHYMEENKEAYNDAREEAKKQWDKKEADEGTMRNEAKMPAPQKM